MMIRYGLLLTMLLSGASARAQQPAAVDTRPPLVLGLYGQGSFIIAHTPSVKHLVKSHPTGLELNVQRQTNGSEPWHAWYNYPKVGLALVYYDYHNPVLGKSYAATVYLNKAIFRSARQELSFRIGTGIGIFPTRYDQETNHKNNFVSSRLNATLQGRLEYDLTVTPHYGLLLGLGLNHYSNGATTKPNFGINLPTVFLGINYHQQRPFRPLSTGPTAEPDEVGHNFLDLSTSLGFKQRNESDRRKYAVQSISAAVGRRVNRKSALVLGAEGFYDRSLLVQLRDTSRAGETLPDVKKAGVFFGHELLFGRLAFVSHLGFYVYNPYKSNKFYYERLGLKYQFTQQLWGSADLKIHRGAADVVELKVGMRL
ncbi:acyloxyacyl hydrolase [Hymenobacter sp. BT635]|uniref:Acyloxyacyl hydrolase n=1 Tax=Hymenobacter nitidus TaxID=2880929 RepID=A0ABS8AI52_9BACT|nr:acyloxyacyl hydrolase [Hymenobacter nitidus]MCB2378905.1 acyloxyacyl hydrolase [Hymenobacter nitidus]